MEIQYFEDRYENNVFSVTTQNEMFQKINIIFQQKPVMKA